MWSELRVSELTGLGTRGSGAAVRPEIVVPRSSALRWKFGIWELLEPFRTNTT